MLLFLYVPVSVVTIIFLVKTKVKVQNRLTLVNETLTNSSISQTKKKTEKAIDTQEKSSLWLHCVEIIINFMYKLYLQEA